MQVATLFDDDGIVVRFMNSMTEGNGIRDAASASALVQEVRFTAAPRIAYESSATLFRRPNVFLHEAAAFQKLQAARVRPYHSLLPSFAV